VALSGIRTVSGITTSPGPLEELAGTLTVESREGTLTQDSKPVRVCPAGASPKPPLKVSVALVT